MNDTRVMVRVQPVGAALLGWTSEGSDDALEDGYVFAYPYDDQDDATLAEQIADTIRREWMLPDESQEVVIFEAEDVYDPGDAEGYACKPVRELRRLPLAL